ncbi:polysialyltransferase family glycosyltransferase [Pseudoalteromonas prydzensis]|uniref:polysialyltransferase family glycosyltransferase n=1 Tax=Pseudoalteromonas prydzensis TaxID=182141 RepID=UPI0037039AD4
MLNNVYIVESPTQLLSAIEAKAVNVGNHMLIVNYGPEDRLENKNQIKELASATSWQYVYRIRNLNNKYLNLLAMFYYLFKFQLKFNRNNTQVYIGEYRNLLFCLIAKVVSKSKIILLDDGAVTILLQKRYFGKGVGLRTYYQGTNSYKVLSLFSRLFSFDFDDNPPNLFSVFNLDKWLFSDQVNTRVKCESTEIETLDDFYFFGAKYSEAGLLSLEVEIKLLKSAFDYSYKKYKRKIIYIAHRDDSNEKLKIIKTLGVEVKYLGKPCEDYFKKLQSVPKYIGGFYTTSLISLPTLFKIDNVLSFDLSTHLTTEKAKGNVEYIYDYLKSIGINVVQV